MKLNAIRSPKFRRLMDLTGLGRAATAGTLELLWLFVMDQSPAGNVGKWSDTDIEAEVAWEGEQGALVSALVASGWVDECEVNRLVIHDWADHMPEFIKKKVARGTISIAVPVQTTADNGGQRPPMADNGALGKSREDKPRVGKISQDKRVTPTARARDVWPTLVKSANALGGSWRDNPGVKQIEIIKARIADGATESDLLDAVRGYILKNGTEARANFDPMAHFTATTVFRASKFDANVEAASRPARKFIEPESASQARQRRTRENAVKALELWENDCENPNLELHAGGKT